MKPRQNLLGILGGRTARKPSARGLSPHGFPLTLEALSRDVQTLLDSPYGHIGFLTDRLYRQTVEIECAQGIPIDRKAEAHAFAEQPGMLANLSRWRSWIQIPLGAPIRREAAALEKWI
jgi:hypothetical protein